MPDFGNLSQSLSLLRLVCISLSLLLASCSDNSNEAGDVSIADVADTEVIVDIDAESTRFIAWLDDKFNEQLDFSPMTKTRMGDRSDYDQLDDVSEAALDARLNWWRSAVAEMKTEFDRDQLDANGQLSWDLWQYSLDNRERNLPFRRYGYIFGRNGPQTGLPNSLINYHDVESKDDMLAYVSRLEQSGRYMGQYLERAQLSVADGIRAPFFDYERAINEIARVTSGEPFDREGNSAIWTDITSKVAALEEQQLITATEASELVEMARNALLGSFKPAYENVSAWLRADLDSVPREATGVWALPNGDAYYAQRLRSMTTLPMSADEIHEIGVSEVARIQAEMEQIKNTVGFDGSLQDFFTYMRDDDQFYFPSTDEGRAQYLELADEILATMSERLPEYFGILPQAGLEVRRVEAFREQAGGAAHYARGTKDGSRPGTFYVHMTDMRAASIFRLENLAYHEGVPGHHMQISIQQEQDDIPLFRANTGYTAFSEGWGLYAEFLGKEMGGYNDPYADFGRLSGEIWRAVRLVVDTGIHAKGWTQAEAVDYALQNSARPEPSVRSEIMRYFNNPGQATAYKIGMLKIQEVRAIAEEALGDSFDIRAFHDLVLGSGPVPMETLQAQVERWIAEQ